jgi:hypothetical protein
MPMRSLNLPSSFVRIHGSLLSSNVILEGPSRKRWKVRVDGSFETLSVSFGEGFAKLCGRSCFADRRSAVFHPPSKLTLPSAGPKSQPKH